jgi:hypothetical protein
VRLFAVENCVAAVNRSSDRSLIGLDRKHPVAGLHQLERKTMTKLLSALVAATFAVASFSPVAFSADKKADTLAEACKGKKTGDEVTVDGKKVKCGDAMKR